MQDLPTLFLQGGSIIPVGIPHLHVGEANSSDDLVLVVALDENGNMFVSPRKHSFTNSFLLGTNPGLFEVRLKLQT